MGRLPATLVLLAVACTTQRVDREALLDPETCGQCHPDHLASWKDGMHAYAADDPVFRAMNERGQRETNGELGDFCVNCHAPMAVREGATTDGLNLDEIDPALKGVTCFFCHTADAVVGTHDADAVKLSEEPVIRGSIADPMPTVAHASAYSPLHDRDRLASSDLCGACHDVVTPLGAHIERTYAEWRESVFNAPTGATCGQCHMERQPGMGPIAQVPGAPDRYRHAHDVPAVDVVMEVDDPRRERQLAANQRELDATLATALCVVRTGPDTSAIRVLVDNVGAGHWFPSGAAQDRRVFTEVLAFDGERELYRSGVVGPTGDVFKEGGPDLWLMRECMYGQDGREVHMFWEAADAEQLMLPAPVTLDPTDPAYTASHRVRAFPKGSEAFGEVIQGVPDRVTLRVRVRPIGHDLLDDLVATGDLDPVYLPAMPTFDLGLGTGPVLTWTPEAVNGTYLEQGVFEARCVTATGLDVTKPKAPAPTSPRCP